MSAPRRAPAADGGHAAQTAQLSALVGSLPSAILVEDGDRRITLVNRTFCDLFGIPAAPDALIGADCSTAAEQAKMLFTDPDSFVRRTTEALTGREPVLADKFEFRDGRILERDYVPVFVEGGAAGHVWNYRDVTVASRALQERDRLRSFHEQVFESLPAQVAVFDLEGRFLYANSESIGDPEVRRWVIGKTNEEYCRHRGLPVGVGEERSAMIRRIVRERRPLAFDETFERHGELWHFRRSLAPVFDASGNVFQVVGFGHDLSHEKRAQVALEAIASRLRGIMQSSLDCVITIDGQGRIVEFSAAAEQTFGRTRDEVIDRRMDELIVPERYRDAHRRGMSHYLATGEGPVLGRRIELSALRADGSEFPVELAITPIAVGDGPPLFTAFLRDITDRKKAELELREAQLAAERLAAAREQFLANVSHELRTPLNAIVGLAYHLERTQLDANQSSALQGIRFSADTLLGVIGDLLDFSRMRAGRIHFELVPFAVDALLDRLINSMAATAEERGLALSYEVDETIPATLRGDPTRLNQILLNLLGNALRFTEHGGVTVRASNRGTDGDSVMVEFSVADTGIGIAQEDQQRIFEFFQQANVETWRRFGGTGLGLAIVQELVRQQGGSVTVESALGAGSTFRVALPFTASDAPAASDPVATTPTLLTGVRLLIAEDNELNRVVATQILESAGARVATANNGREAVARVQAEHFDLVLMDVQMPEMDGFEAAWLIRQKLGIPESRLPIVALTASVLTDEQRHAEAAGMTDVILKPFRPDLLCQRIADILARVRPDGAAHPSHVNRASLAANTLHQDAFTAQVVEIFLQNAPDLLRSLESATAGGDRATTVALAHQLKSQAGTIGADGLQRALHSLELQSRGATATTSELAGLARDVARLGHEVLREVETIARQLRGDGQ